jgi:cytochrome c oxidase cbb3-type subunit III
MPGRTFIFTASLAGAAILAAFFSRTNAQSNNPNELHAVQQSPTTASQMIEKSGQCDLRQIPMVNITPGAISPCTEIKNPNIGNPQAVERGMKYFTAFNCVGCHAPNGAGGMGPALSDDALFKYGTDPSVLFLVISHGAPNGMPAWGTVLPKEVIWDLVSYIESINKAPHPEWGTTVSAGEHLPTREQVPAEFKQTPTPWDFTEPFSNGKKPTGANPTGADGSHASANSQ